MPVRWRLGLSLAILCLVTYASASLGDRLPEFKECVALCQQNHCVDQPVSIPLHHRLLLWTCPSECDYNCQHIVTDLRLSRDHPYLHPVYQFHGKWPFYRFLGIQEPFSVLFSLFNLLAHAWGISRLRDRIPHDYPLRKYYLVFGYVGLVSWTASCIFHTRDFTITERADYFAAGASVLYGLYFVPIRLFRLDDPTRSAPYKSSLLRFWTLACLVLYLLHVSYLTLFSWDYTYNMAANIAVGVVQNILLVAFSFRRYKKTRRVWTAWPAMIVLWIALAMSLEVLDFVPWGRMVDAHSLWHLGTVGPTIWWYIFMTKDAEEDMQDVRFKM